MSTKMAIICSALYPKLLQPLLLANCWFKLFQMLAKQVLLETVKDMHTVEGRLRRPWMSFTASSSSFVRHEMSWNLMKSHEITNHRLSLRQTPQNMNRWVRDDLNFSNWGGSSSCSCFPWILYHWNWKQENLQEDVAPPTIEPILQSFCPMLSKPHSSKSVLGILDAQLGKSLESRQHRHKIQVIQARLNCLGCIILFGWSVSSSISKSTTVENWVLLGIPLLLKLWTTILWSLLTSQSWGDRDLPSNAMQLPAIWQQSAESVSSIVQLPHRALELEGVAACERNRFPSASPCADLGSAQEIIIDHPYTSTGWILTSSL